jgi:hypothetical protein
MINIILDFGAVPWRQSSSGAWTMQNSGESRRPSQSHQILERRF